MQITLQTNNSPNNMINKSLTDVATMDIVAHNDFNIDNPFVLLAEWDSVPDTVNYATIGTSKYFVTGRTREIGNKIRLTLARDVLTTYAAEIMDLTVVSERATANANRYVADSIQSLSAKPQVQYKQFDTTPFNPSTVTSDTPCIVVRAIVSPKTVAPETGAETEV